ncbi:nicotinate-nucleotide adenylyltransferase [Loktanella fryxellensis]|uniref:Probable nicotinate-nucleotide adenylyltransferase n=1 Tax=Loktanella fryxellensis TaxID=245187 RepID=A0A1H8AGF6_9RHOB|nr:nicotinate-nucleotide adenylyltransferase [Loktanella fryxellensis]SEM69855.1 nicotinate-nucleotide adenylyltransferase [Loktanella fryxellensis]
MQGWPQARTGQVIGLLGGSFDPAHPGHVLITHAALRRFALDRVWWMVSPGNPLKAQGPAPLADRMAAARRVMRHPRVTVTDIEATLHTRHTARTLRLLQARYPGVRFVWLMGADNMTQLHHWQDWRWIMDHVAVGVLARPGDRLRARLSMAAQVYRHAQVPAAASRSLGRRAAPAWCFVDLPLSGQSSSAIRASGAWRKRDGTPTVLGPGDAVRSIP